MIRTINYPGGKCRILKHLFPLLVKPERPIYVEPFMGSGAVWMNLVDGFKNANARGFDRLYLSDSMPYMVKFFEDLKLCPDDVKRHLLKLGKEYPTGLPRELKRKVILNEKLSEEELEVFSKAKDNYYSYRMWWNDNKEVCSYAVTAGFVYLCGACVNGLVRFGRDGRFNQGWGQRQFDMKNFDDMLRTANSERIYFKVEDFRTAIDRRLADANQTVFYLDPPYGTRCEDDVNGIYELGRKWTAMDDALVSRACFEIHVSGGHFVLSNIRENGRILDLISFRGFRVIEVPLTYKSSVGRHPAKKQSEILITNDIS